MIELNEEAFMKFLRRSGRSQSVAQHVVAMVTEFERYLREERGGKGLHKAAPADLTAFVSSVEQRKKGSAKKYLHSVGYYYAYSSNPEMRNFAGSLRRQKIAQKPFPLKDFRGIDPKHMEKLATLGIRNVKDMLEAGRTPSARAELSSKTGIPVVAILELVKLSDLARIQGVKSIRARLYCDAGIDTLDKMASWEPQELRAMLIDFVDKTGFKGIAPLPKEIENTVAEAKRLPRIVEY